jgi:bacillolysin
MSLSLALSAEWSHGYTQTGDDLVYQYQSGSMNEGFSDVFGESIDILNADSADTDVLRQASPATCTSTLNSRYGAWPLSLRHHHLVLK